MNYLNGRVYAGLALVFVGAALCSLLSIGVISGGYNKSSSDVGFVAFAVLFCFVPFLVAGSFFLWSGFRLARRSGVINQQEKFLGMIAARGQVSLSDAALELGMTPAQLKDLLYQIIGQKKFSGYIHWGDQVIYSAQARNLLEQQQCLHCGGQLTIAGQGMVVCPFCGAETFVAS